MLKLRLVVLHATDQCSTVMIIYIFFIIKQLLIRYWEMTSWILLPLMRDLIVIFRYISTFFRQNKTEKGYKFKVGATFVWIK